MCEWQSQAPAGTSKFTFVAGCDALAWPKRGCIKMPVAAVPSTNSRRRIIITSLLKVCIFRSSLSARRRHGILDNESILNSRARGMGIAALLALQNHRAYGLFASDLDVEQARNWAERIAS